MTRQYADVLLIKKRKLDSDLATILRCLSSRLAGIDSPAGDLTQTPTVACLLINQLLQPASQDLSFNGRKGVSLLQFDLDGMPGRFIIKPLYTVLIEQMDLPSHLSDHIPRGHVAQQ